MGIMWDGNTETSVQSARREAEEIVERSMQEGKINDAEREQLMKAIQERFDLIEHTGSERMDLATVRKRLENWIDDRAREKQMGEGAQRERRGPFRNLF